METKEEKQLKLDKRYIRMASIWAENSYCERRQVGALIVKDKMIISDGYNGNSTKQQQQRRSNHVRHRISLHRMCQTHHPSRNQTCSLLRKIPFGRRA